MSFLWPEKTIRNDNLVYNRVENRTAICYNKKQPDTMVSLKPGFGAAFYFNVTMVSLLFSAYCLGLIPTLFLKVRLKLDRFLNPVRSQTCSTR